MSPPAIAGAARLLAVASAFTLPLLACDGEPASEAPAVTYYQDIKPILDAACVGCHHPGGAGPVTLATYEGVAAVAELALLAMETGRMPPWMPDPDCRRYRHERLMDASDIELVRAWVAGGALPGDGAGAVPWQPPAPAFEPTHRIPFGGGYLTDASGPDDYRCFVLDVAFPEDTYLTGSQIEPGSAEVHHVLVYAIAPSQLADLAAAEAADPGEGYTCFGGPLPSGPGSGQEGIATAITGYFAGGELPPIDFPTQLAGWAPGAIPAVRPPGQGTRIVSGSRVVVQVHYSTALGAIVDPGSELQLRLTSEAPETLEITRPFAALDLFLPAGEAEVVVSRALPYHGAEPLVIQAVAGHMHLLGTRIRADVLRGEGGEECMLDIPAWDFHWQQSYHTLPDDRIVVAPGDTVQLTCHYDNSAANQPIFGGVQVTSRDVTWGDGTLDEMCLLYTSSLRPFTPSPPAGDAPCAGLDACLAGCPEGDTLGCLLGCEQAVLGCHLCGLRAGLRCSEFACLGDLQAMGGCLGVCVGANITLTGNVGACLEAECVEAFGAFRGCVEAGLAATACDDELASCGLVR